MATTDTSERALETRIVGILTGNAHEAIKAGQVHETSGTYSTSWIQGEPADYDRAYCVDLKQFSTFLEATQPTSPQPFPWTRTATHGANSSTG